MSKNSLAKKAGIITGISYKQAKQICPELGYVKADYKKYLHETKNARDVYRKYTETVIPYGLDEAWVDLSDTGVTWDETRQIAELIRIEILYSLGLSASIGISDNYIFSKLGSDLTQPNSVTEISKDNFRNAVWSLPAKELLFVGECRYRLLMANGINTIGDIARSAPNKLGKLLGKVGYNLWQYANGDDSAFNPMQDDVKSIGNTITPPSDLHTEREASAIIYMLVNSICVRLRKHNKKAGCVSVCMKDSKFDTLIRQKSIANPTDNLNHIFNQAYGLFKKHYKWEHPLRSVGVRVDNLKHGDEQMSFVDFEDDKINADIDNRLKDLFDKYGELKMEKAATTRDFGGVI
jgi:DNA polymerase-4